MVGRIDRLARLSQRPVMRRSVVAVAALVLLGSVSGCSLRSGPAGPGVMPLVIENSTTLDIVVLVNGRRIEVAHGASTQLGTDVLGPRPWAVEARTAVSGRLVGSMQVDPAAGTCQTAGDGTGMCTGAVDLHDLTCGRFLMTVGLPSVPAPIPGAGAPGDCDP